MDQLRKRQIRSQFEEIGETTESEAEEEKFVVTKEKNWANWWVRTYLSLIMSGAFIVIVLSGPLYIIALVSVLQLVVFKEVISIAHVPSKEKKLPWFRILNWYFLLALNFYLYGDSINEYFGPLEILKHHLFVSYMFYIFGIVLFVLSLRKGHYKFQFAQFAWTHMVLMTVTLQIHLTMQNILDGLIWFFLPSSLVIINDVSAYIFGFFFGKTRLIRLSPKKTWEGFIGGAIMTLILGFILASLFASFDYFVCPIKDIHTNVFNYPNCSRNPVFEYAEYKIPFLKVKVAIAPIQFHSLVLVVFASTIAPFGGFFASGVKRAFKIKDFADFIPGHGGVTDRLDCQFAMGVFCNLYFRSFIRTRHINADQIYRIAMSQMDPSEIPDLIELLKEKVKNK
eukprot:NODE_861_length_3456_cov_0.504617.p2 type:complete len:396 gc:universal NODE_861_length_3456_cov_0.504617:266-1453(+)